MADRFADWVVTLDGVCGAQVRVYLTCWESQIDEELDAIGEHRRVVEVEFDGLVKEIGNGEGCNPQEGRTALRRCAHAPVRHGLMPCRYRPVDGYLGEDRGQDARSGSLLPLKQQLVNADGDVVPRSEVVTGYAVADRYVPLDASEKPSETDGDGSVVLTACVAHVPAEYVLSTALCWPLDDSSDDTYA